MNLSYAISGNLNRFSADSAHSVHDSDRLQEVDRMGQNRWSARVGICRLGNFGQKGLQSPVKSPSARFGV